MAPSSTILFDLDKDVDALFSAISKPKRRNIRNGLRAGVRVREGDAQDIPVFYELHASTSRRQSFSPYPESYFDRMWRAFRPSGGCHLLLAECDGEVVSGMFLLTVGHTVYTLANGWSGRYPERRPNDVLHWEVLNWGKQRGYRSCDLVWIDPRAGDAAVAGLPLPPDLQESATAFKLRLGGRVTQYPRGYDIVFNPLLRPLYRAAVPALYAWPAVKSRLFALRWRWFAPGSAQAGAPST